MPCRASTTGRSCRPRLRHANTSNATAVPGGQSRPAKNSAVRGAIESDGPFSHPPQFGRRGLARRLIGGPRKPSPAKPAGAARPAAARYHEPCWVAPSITRGPAPRPIPRRGRAAWIGGRALPDSANGSPTSAPRNLTDGEAKAIFSTIDDDVRGDVANALRGSTIFPENCPSRVYHYTSLDGLLGILKSQQIWATDIRYLNDASEDLYATRAIEQVLTEMGTDDNAQPGLTAAINMSRPTTSRAHAACFCQARDLLSQWRAHSAGGTTSYALEFDWGAMSTMSTCIGEYGERTGRKAFDGRNGKPMVVRQSFSELTFIL